MTAPTAQLATALLKPVVRPDEAREYEAWTSQFRHLSLAGQDLLSEKDRHLYAQHASTIVTPNPLSEKDAALFASTVLLSQPPKGFKVDSGVTAQSSKAYREMVEGPGL
jgi:hypothetical protein